MRGRAVDPSGGVAAPGRRGRMLAGRIWVGAGLLLLCLAFAAGPAAAAEKDGTGIGQGGGRTAETSGEAADDAAAAQAFSAGEYRLALLPPLGQESGAGCISRTALRRIAEIQGLPYDFVESSGQLSSYSAAVLAEGPSNPRLNSRWREALYSFVEEGGVLIVPAGVGSELHSLLGIRAVDSSRQRERLSFSGNDPLLSYIDHPRERTISLGNGEEEVYEKVIWSHGVETAPLAETLARFDDGSAGLVRHYYGRGIVYYLGLSFEETVMLPQSGGDYEAQRTFVNSFEPSADVIMLLIRALYEHYVPQPVYLSPVPQARPTALVLTHDVDAQTSFLDSLKFASLAEEFGARATFFVTTKYFEDRKDIAYYRVPENLDAVRRLHERGHEIGSHTVTHALSFDEAQPGSPQVSYETYRPEERITIHGEVRVSRELLERDLSGQRTVSFRAGYLAYPRELIAVLESAGYRYDSSFSANDVLTTFPYFAFPERRPMAEESEVIEIPLTLDDALGFLTEERKEEAARIWKEILRENAANESITVLLNHPSDTRQKRYKLEAQRELMRAARQMDAWIGPLRAFGDFWRARHGTSVAGVRRDGGRMVIRLSRPASSLHKWTGLVVADPSGVDELEVRDSAGQPVSWRRRAADGKWYLRLAPGS